MQRARNIEAEITFLRTEEGGRQGPVRSGYRPQFHCNDQDWDAMHEYVDREWVHPGETVKAYLTFLSPQCHVGNVDVGTEFLVREGTKVVAKGHVTRILHLPDSARREGTRGPRGDGGDDA